MFAGDAATPYAVLTTFFDISGLKRAEQALRTHAEQLRQLSHRLFEVEESERRAIEDAVSDLKEALKGDDAEAIKAKTNTVAQASMKLGEAMYKQQAEADAKKDAAKDDVVDAEFTEVDDDKNNKKSA